MAKTNWRRIGLVATILFVPGGFLLGASMAAKRLRKDAPEAGEDAAEAALPEPAPHESAIDAQAPAGSPPNP